MFRLLFFFLFFGYSLLDAHPLEEITKDYLRAKVLWQLSLKQATTPSAKQQVFEKRPDRSHYAIKIKKILPQYWQDAAGLEASAWLLNNDWSKEGKSTLSSAYQYAILENVERYHLQSVELAPLLLSFRFLRSDGSLPPAHQPPLFSKGMSLLEKIKKEHPHTSIRGVAALSLALMQAQLGDSPQIIARRLSNLKFAAQHASHLEVQGMKLSQTIRGAIYLIANLSKGRNAPLFEGHNAKLETVRLSEYRGKVVLLAFWASYQPHYQHALDLLQRIAKACEGKPCAILAVNGDSLALLRSLEAQKNFAWTNISDADGEIAKLYASPYGGTCYVLNKQGVICYQGPIGSFSQAVINDLLQTPQK